MWEENNFAVSLRVKRGHGYFLLTSLIVPVSGIFSSFDRVARNVPLDEEMNNVRSMGPDRPNNANLCPKKWWRYIRVVCSDAIGIAEMAKLPLLIAF